MVDSFTWQNVLVPIGPSSVAKKGYKTEEGPFGAEMFCQVKLSTTCLTLKNQQIPVHRRGNESLLFQVLIIIM